ncbi:histidine phosphatase family protein [Stappia sp. F7233]|uniref:Histidine phosphatase family protein n=2 Tax=Stappia albiluteola TaxID=2758565 RepID=A0A839AHD2_9HYPH|nr:histidine phosphatase family protein [Stappia albiluteola]
MLLRHAKSDWSEAGLHDFDRPLNERGRQAAPLMGAHLATHALLPDRILCSTARRARETLALMLPHLSGDSDVGLTRRLYDEGEDDYVAIIHALGGNAHSLMLIAHNPAIQATALALIGNGNPALRDEIAEKFPTAALAVIDFDAESWADVEKDSGRVVAFFRPKLLAGGITGEAANES